MRMIVLFSLAAALAPLLPAASSIEASGLRWRVHGRSGKVQVWVDGRTSPSLVACDMSLGAGKDGLGSFFDTGEFRNVRIHGETAGH